MGAEPTLDAGGAERARAAFTPSSTPPLSPCEELATMLGAFGWGADAAAREAGGGPVIGRRFSFVGPVVRTVRSAVRPRACSAITTAQTKKNGVRGSCTRMLQLADGVAPGIRYCPVARVCQGAPWCPTEVAPLIHLQGSAMLRPAAREDECTLPSPSPHPLQL